MSAPNRTPAGGHMSSPSAAKSSEELHQVGAELARELLASSAPSPSRGFRPLAASIFDFAESLGRLSAADLEASL